MDQPTLLLASIHASVGNGMLTVFQPDPLTGKIISMQEGGSLGSRLFLPRDIFVMMHIAGEENVDLFVVNVQCSVIGNNVIVDIDLTQCREKVGQQF